MRKTDVLIAGGAFAGLSLAIALRQALGSSFAVVVADPAFGRSGADPRASAIAAAARRLLETIGVWQDVAAEAQPILDMVVTDSKLQDAVRPTFLTFGGDVAPGEPFAHMIENAPLLAALYKKAAAEGVTLIPAAVETFGDDVPVSDEYRSHQPRSAAMPVSLDDGTVWQTRLLVAADGTRSRVRERAGIVSHGWSYGQSAIVTTVAHERDHKGRAEEHFLPSGPFAILPLKDNRSSIVWTERAAEAARIVALDDAAFLAELEQRFGLHLGDISLAGSRHAYPLGFAVARSFVADRVALLGDAAHMIHPIAGQGLNMGMRDVAALAEVIADAARLGLDPGSADVLERYQRWRRFDTMTMGIATDGLNRLFSNHSDVLRLARDIGLGMVDRMPGLKGSFIRQAAGISGVIPRLLRGESL